MSGRGPSESDRVLARALDYVSRTPRLTLAAVLGVSSCVPARGSPGTAHITPKSHTHHTPTWASHLTPLPGKRTACRHRRLYVAVFGPTTICLAVAGSLLSPGTARRASVRRARSSHRFSHQHHRAGYPPPASPRRVRPRASAAVLRLRRNRPSSQKDAPAPARACPASHQPR